MPEHIPSEYPLWPMPLFTSEPLEELELATEDEAALWALKVQRERQAYLSE